MNWLPDSFSVEKLFKAGKNEVDLNEVKKIAELYHLLVDDINYLTKYITTQEYHTEDKNI